VGGGYGEFVFEGTEDQAEEMRAHKARWERAVAQKYRIPELTSWQRQALEVVSGENDEDGFLDTSLLSQLIDLGICEWKDLKIHISPLGKWILANESC
jgi:hypothetical protein